MVCDRPLEVGEEGTGFTPVNSQPDDGLVSGTFEPMSERRVLRLAIPIVGEYLLQTSVAVVNTLMVSAAGATALAAVAVATPVIFFYMALFSSVSIGATVLVAQSIGHGSPGDAADHARQALAWGFVLVAPLSVLLYLLAPHLVHAFGSDMAVQRLASTYLQIIGAMSAVMLVSYLCGSILRGAGDGRTPLKAALLANVVNLASCFLLITGRFGFVELGVVGAAWGQVLGRAAGALVMVLVLCRGSNVISLRGGSGWRPRGDAGKRLFGIGVPAAIEQISNEGGFIVISAVTASIGVAALSAHQIGFTALELWYMPALALSVTGTALVGQSVGAGRPTDGFVAARIIHRWVILWMVSGLVVFVVAMNPILRAFSDDPDVLEQGRSVLVAMGIGLPAWGLWLTTTGTLRGTGDTRSPMLRGIIAIWTAVILSWIGVYQFDLGIGWIWTTYAIALPISIVGNWFAFRRRIASLVPASPLSETGFLAP
jgi:putative MATE family efflux protein